jgi:hypothetical protein
LSKGSIISLSEFGDATGRVDFFIPAAHWGIQLLRDGSKLAEHSERFMPGGAYGKWIRDSNMGNYIILDFKRSIPKQRHPGLYLTPQISH